MDWRGKKTLVTGGAGLIGSHLVDELVKRGADVVIIDNLTEQTHPFGKPSWINPKAEFVCGDIRNRRDLEKVLPGVEYIFHQAAFGGFTTQLSLYTDTNTTGTARIFEVIQDKKIPVKKIVAASSQAVYGEGTYRSSGNEVYYPKKLRLLSQLQTGAWELQDEHGTAMTPMATKEDKPLYTETIYGISKLGTEKLTIGLGRNLEIPTVALRYAVTYGPRQSIFNPYTGVVSIFSTQLLNEVPPVVYEDGNQTRDYLYVSDNVAANLCVMEKDDANWQVFNVGSGAPTSINQLVQLLARYYNKEHIVPNVSGEFRPGDVRHFVHDSAKLKKLGWQPTVSLEEGLSQYVDWIKTQGTIKEYFSHARHLMRNAGIVHTR